MSKDQKQDFAGRLQAAVNDDRISGTFALQVRQMHLEALAQEPEGEGLQGQSTHPRPSAQGGGEMTHKRKWRWSDVVFWMIAGLIVLGVPAMALGLFLAMLSAIERHAR